MKQKKVLLLYTGGTIGMEKNYATGSLQPFNFQNISDKIPELALLDCEISIHSLETPLDSSDVGPHEWIAMAQTIAEKYSLYDGFVILHGTDTMSYTASALSFMLKNVKKPVVITGSQLPIGDLRTDAKENLLTGIHYATLTNDDGTPKIQEVTVYFEYKLLRGNRSIKYSAENFDAYQSPNFPALGQSGVHLALREELLWRTEKFMEFCFDPYCNTNVGLLRIFPGMDYSLLNHFSEKSALVLQVYGSGTILNQPSTRQALENVRKNGCQLIVTSQCVSGGITFGKYANSIIFKDIGAISAGDMTVEAALTKAMHVFGNPTYADELSAYQSSLCGESSM